MYSNIDVKVGPKGWTKIYWHLYWNGLKFMRRMIDLKNIQNIELNSSYRKFFKI